MKFPADFEMKDWQKTIIKKMTQIINNGGRLILRPHCPGKRMRRLHYFLNPDHTYRECDLMTWARQFENEDRRVAEDEVKGCVVSTVWLGTNHNYWGGPPLVFETMVFELTEPLNYLNRYTTWDQALVGHQEAIDWVKNGCKED